RVARLEGALGVRLLNRTTRRVSPTEEGATFYEHCLSILNELEQAESVISERLTEPRGPIKVTLPSVFRRMHVAPHVPALLARPRLPRPPSPSPGPPAPHRLAGRPGAGAHRPRHPHRRARRLPGDRPQAGPQPPGHRRGAFLPGAPPGAAGAGRPLEAQLPAA